MYGLDLVTDANIYKKYGDKAYVALMDPARDPYLWSNNNYPSYYEKATGYYPWEKWTSYVQQKPDVERVSRLDKECDDNCVNYLRSTVIGRPIGQATTQARNFA